MSLASGVSDLATRIAAFLKSSVVPRLLPAGGVANQVLTKSSPNDFVASWTSPPQDVGFFCVGKQASASEVLGIFVATRAFTLPAGLVGSVAIANIAATADTVLTLTKITGTGSTATSSTIGTLKFAAGAFVGVFTSASATGIAAGDRIVFTGAATADSTLADFGATLAGSR
jgi:hypothetical protein